MFLFPFTIAATIVKVVDNEPAYIYIGRTERWHQMPKEKNIPLIAMLEAYRAGRITREAMASRLAEGLNRQEDINFFLNRTHRAINLY